MGHDECEVSQRSMHFSAWKKWPQGSVRSTSPSIYSLRHTVHSVDAFPMVCSPCIAASASPLQWRDSSLIQQLVSA